MFHIGDTVVYGSSGVCRITDLKEETIGGSRQTYYLLTPLKDLRSTYYCPVNREDKIRPLVAENEARALMTRAAETGPVWIEDEGVRQEQFTAMLKSGDHLQLIRLIRSLLRHRQQREAAGKRLRLSDQRMLEEARRVLYGEFSHVLSLSPDQVSGYIESV